MILLGLISIHIFILTTSCQCFYQSDTDPGIGFLIVRKDPSRREDLYEQWNAYNYLSKNYNRHNFLLDPPYEQNVSEAFAYKLNSLASAHSSNHKGGGDRYLSDHPVVVQKVKRAPDKSIMIRCNMNGQHKMQNDLRNLLASMSGNKQSFAQQLRKGLTTAIYVMEQEPWYANDWQALLDSDGQLVDIDVSQIRPETIVREFSASGTFKHWPQTRLDWIDQCCNSFEEILRQVMPADNATICSTNLHSLRLEDLNKNPVICDDAVSELCLFGDSKNAHVGYLVANTANKDAHSMFKSNWEVARMLTNDYKINHNILGSPQQVNSTLMVQKVKRFHNMTVLFTCNNKLPESFMFGGEEVDSFIGYIENSKLFKSNVKHQAKKITNMLIETNQSLLDSSFQVRVDSQGYVYLLNLHNVMKKEIPTLMSLECLKALAKWADSVL